MTFHAHLDECRQCREQPFNLCDVGFRLILEAPVDLIAPLSFGERLWNRGTRSGCDDRTRKAR